jgi:hypothetical protein
MVSRTGSALDRDNSRFFRGGKDLKSWSLFAEEIKNVRLRPRGHKESNDLLLMIDGRFTVHVNGCVGGRKNLSTIDHRPWQL